MNFTVVCLTDLTRRSLDVDERRYLVGRGVVTEIQSNMGEYMYRCGYLTNGYIPTSYIKHA